MKTDTSFRFLSLVFMLLSGLLLVSCGEEKNSGNTEEPPVIVTPDPPQPVEKPAEKQYQDGKASLTPGSGQDFKKAFDLFLDAAKSSYDSAQVAVGYLYEYGMGTQQDMSQAIHYYEEAAKQGNGEAVEKVNYLKESNSRLDLPADFPVPASDLLIWEGETVRPVNGDLSFRCYDSDVFITDESGNPVYFSFRSPDSGSEVRTALVLDAKETAVSMLLSSIPMISECGDETFFLAARAATAALPETEDLARAIEASVLKNGHMEIGDIAQATVSASTGFLERIGLVDLEDASLDALSAGTRVVRSGAPIFGMSSSAASSALASSASGGQSRPEIVFDGNMGDIVWAEFSKNDPSYKEAKDRMEWEMTVFNSLPIYLALLPAKASGFDMFVPDSKTTKTEFLVRPSNISDIYKDIGLKGPLDFFKNMKTFYTQDLGTVYSGLRYWIQNGTLPEDYVGMKSTRSSGKVSLPINDDDDCLLVTSVDTNPELLEFAVFDIVVFPVLKKCIKKLRSIDDKTMLMVFEQFTKYLDPNTLNNIGVCIKNKDKEKLHDILMDRAEKFLENGTDWFYDLVKNKYIKWGPVAELKVAVEEAVTKGITTLAVVKKTLEVVELVGNFLLWSCNQFSFSSYPIMFNVPSDGPPSRLEPVDLGLSVYWANCNVGATAPRGFGKLFAWGEVSDKETFSWSNYSHGTSEGNMSKYNLYPETGSQVDGLGVLLSEDDAAHVLWGEKWRMPTREEYEELLEKCDCEPVNVFPYGFKVRSRHTGKTLFLPASGAEGEGSASMSRSSWGQYWSSSLSEGASNFAGMLRFRLWDGDVDCRVAENYRYVGQSIRPVADIARIVLSDETVDMGTVRPGSQTKRTIMLHNRGVGTMSVVFKSVDAPFSIDRNNLTTYSVQPDQSLSVEVTFSPASDASSQAYSGLLVFETNSKGAPTATVRLLGRVDLSGSGEQARPVDLGLSVKWASMNVGATSPEGYGLYLAWGETDEDQAYIWKNYLHCDGSQTALKKYYAGDGKSVLEQEDDAAGKLMGEGWRMPTEAEFKELLDKCEWSELIRLNGVSGRFVYNSSDRYRYMFLPMGGYKFNQTVTDLGTAGYYWTSSLWKSDPKLAHSGKVEAGTQYVNGTSRAYGLSVRAVQTAPYNGGGDIEGTIDEPWN